MAPTYLANVVLKNVQAVVGLHTGRSRDAYPLATVAAKLNVAVPGDCRP